MKRTDWFEEARFGMFIHFAARRYKDIQFVTLGTQESYTYPLPDPRDTVLEITTQ